MWKTVLNDLIEHLERLLGKEADTEMMNMHFMTGLEGEMKEK